MDSQPGQPDDATDPAPRQQLERVGVAGLWLRDGRLLVTRRAHGIPYGDQWCFPGGGVEPGEDEVAALRREWMEELGVDVRPIRRLGSSWAAGGRFFLQWYLVEAEGELRPNPAEVSEVRWVAVEELAGMSQLLASNRELLASMGPQLTEMGRDARGRTPRPKRSAADEAQGTGAVAPTAGARSGDWRSQLRGDLDALREAGLGRSLRVVGSPCGRTILLESAGGPREVIHFASNDYLGLASDPRVVRAAQEAAEQWGWGAGGSRLICGHTALHEQLETAIAAFEGTEAALVLPTGYMANVAALRALAGEGDVVLLDKLDHASIIDAAAGSGAEVRVFPHRNYARLAQLLERYGSARRRVIVTDSVFSMDGDTADLPALVALKARYDAVLVVDEAHATGVLGTGGRGLAELQGVGHGVDVTVGTLSKALGGAGGFVAGPRVLIETIVNRGRSFIFTTAQPAAGCAAALRALEIVQAEPQRRQRVLALAERLRGKLLAAGWDCGDSWTQIVPIMAGEPARAVQLADALLERGLFVPAVRPPAVPPAGSRLRISISAAHTEADIDRLAEALAGLRVSQTSR